MRTADGHLDCEAGNIHHAQRAGDGTGRFQQRHFQINLVLTEQCGQIYGKITGLAFDQLAVVDVYEKFEVHAALLWRKFGFAGV